MFPNQTLCTRRKREPIVLLSTSQRLLALLNPTVPEAEIIGYRVHPLQMLIPAWDRTNPVKIHFKISLGRIHDLSSCRASVIPSAGLLPWSAPKSSTRAVRKNLYEQQSQTTTVPFELSILAETVDRKATPVYQCQLLDNVFVDTAEIMVDA
ncbi:MAG: hypothetical protein L6R40_003484 [Gallowayella cf. fulva]|nr:MAG: hypothetical protein L6R40_003484 [Xanthomendoza cf. fulva]